MSTVHALGGDFTNIVQEKKWALSRNENLGLNPKDKITLDSNQLGTLKLTVTKVIVTTFDMLEDDDASLCGWGMLSLFKGHLRQVYGMKADETVYIYGVKVGWE